MARLFTGFKLLLYFYMNSVHKCKNALALIWGRYNHLSIMSKHDSFLYGTHFEQNIFVQVSFRQTAYELLAGIISSRMDASSIVC